MGTKLLDYDLRIGALLAGARACVREAEIWIDEEDGDWELAEHHLFEAANLMRLYGEALQEDEAEPEKAEPAKEGGTLRALPNQAGAMARPQ